MVLLGETRQRTDIVYVYNLLMAVLHTTELAQLEERSAFNRVVVGSSPIFGVCCQYFLPSSIPQVVISLAFALLIPMRCTKYFHRQGMG